MKFKSIKLAFFAILLLIQSPLGQACTDYTVPQEEAVVDSASAISDLIRTIKVNIVTLNEIIKNDSVQGELDWNRVKKPVSRINSELKEIKKSPLAQSYLANVKAAEKHAYKQRTKYPTVNVNCGTCRTGYHGCDCMECGAEYGTRESCVRRAHGHEDLACLTLCGFGYFCYLYEWILAPIFPDSWACSEMSCATVTYSQGGTFVNSEALKHSAFQIQRALEEFDQYLHNTPAEIQAAISVELQAPVGEQMIRDTDITEGTPDMELTVIRESHFPQNYKDRSRSESDTHK